MADFVDKSAAFVRWAEQFRSKCCSL